MQIITLDDEVHLDGLLTLVGLGHHYGDDHYDEGQKRDE